MTDTTQTTALFLADASQAEIDHHFMHQALVLADYAQSIGEIPVGAVLVDGKHKIIAEGWNNSIINHDPTAHAEIDALRKGAKHIENYRLLDTTLYVTLEPCTMCAGAILHARVKRLVFGANDHKTGAVGSRFHFFDDYKMNHAIEISGGILAEQCSNKLSEFFKQRRLAKKEQKSG